MPLDHVLVNSRLHGEDCAVVVTAAVTPTSKRRESTGTATPMGGVTSDDDVEGHMTKTDTCFSLLSPDESTTDAGMSKDRFNFTCS